MSPYDPYGIVSPAMLDTKLIQRGACPPKNQDPYNCHHKEWYDSLPECLKSKGHDLHPKQWKYLRTARDKMIKNITSLHVVIVPRSVYSSGIPGTQQLFTFADASDVAIA